MMENKKTILLFIVLIISILAIIIHFLLLSNFPEFIAPDSVKSPVIEIDQPESGYYAGDTFMISGNTTLANGEEIIVHFYLSSYIHGIKARPDNISRKVSTQVVQGRSGLNRWSATIDTTGFWPDEYIIMAYSNNTGEINTSSIVFLNNKDEDME